jgi:hypothetical protein
MTALNNCEVYRYDRNHVEYEVSEKHQASAQLALQLSEVYIGYYYIGHFAKFKKVLMLDLKDIISGEHQGVFPM